MNYSYGLLNGPSAQTRIFSLEAESFTESVRGKLVMLNKDDVPGQTPQPSRHYQTAGGKENKSTS